VRARLLLGWDFLERREPQSALDQFLAALEIPGNLGEVKHLLANQSNIHYWIGEALARSGQNAKAGPWWLRAAKQKGDFQQMAVRDVSSMTFWSGLALQSLGRTEEATALFRRVFDYSAELEGTEPKIDYFATSLPAMLLFDEDLAKRNHIEALFLRSQASIGLGRGTEAGDFLREVLALDGSHPDASDLLRQLGQLHKAERVR
jgi:tetratricopeptide (TPR) repeat protein